jgi:prepilin-type N-terminal cleavage/methylation domain-containing protein
MMKSKKGFTLVELIITIALVAIIGAIMGLNLHAYTLNRNLKSAARAITSDFFHCKGKAISENTRYQIDFDVANGSYTIQPGTPAAVTKHLSEFGPDIEFVNASFGKGHTIHFYTRGTAAPGNINLKNSRQSNATIKVNITGRTHVAFDIQ